MAAMQDEPTFIDRGALDWGALVALVIHPTKVLILEAMQWIGEPLSASELEQIFDKKLSLGSISYHIRTLAKYGALEQIRSRHVRGTIERYYSLAPAVRRS
jgi:DNA-binding transcriptional ArsR family regulator